MSLPTILPPLRSHRSLTKRTSVVDSKFSKIMAADGRPVVGSKTALNAEKITPLFGNFNTKISQKFFELVMNNLQTDELRRQVLASKFSFESLNNCHDLTNRPMLLKAERQRRCFENASKLFKFALPPKTEDNNNKTVRKSVRNEGFDELRKRFRSERLTFGRQNETLPNNVLLSKNVVGKKKTLGTINGESLHVNLDIAASPRMQSILTQSSSEEVRYNSLADQIFMRISQYNPHMRQRLNKRTNGRLHLMSVMKAVDLNSLAEQTLVDREQLKEDAGTIYIGVHERNFNDYKHCFPRVKVITLAKDLSSEKVKEQLPSEETQQPSRKLAKRKETFFSGFSREPLFQKSSKMSNFGVGIGMDSVSSLRSAFPTKSSKFDKSGHKQSSVDRLNDLTIAELQIKFVKSYLSKLMVLVNKLLATRILSFRTRIINPVDWSVFPAQNYEEKEAMIVRMIGKLREDLEEDRSQNEWALFRI